MREREEVCDEREGGGVCDERGREVCDEREGGGVCDERGREVCDEREGERCDEKKKGLWGGEEECGSQV